MASQGPSNPDTVSDDAAVGTVAWNNPTNAATSNDSRSTAAGAGQSHYLKAVDFDFAIPAGATVDGITVAIERQSSSAGATVDTVVSLVKGGSVVGDNKASAVAWNAGSDTTQDYGGAAELWGTTWNAAEINAADFGVVLSATNTGAVSARVDAFSVTVDYTEASGLAARRALLGVGV